MGQSSTARCSYPRQAAKSAARGSLAHYIQRMSSDGEPVYSLISFAVVVSYDYIQRVPILRARQSQQMSDMGGANGNYMKLHVYTGVNIACARPP